MMPSYASLESLKTVLSISATADDDMIQSFLDIATKRIVTFCARSFHAYADKTRYYDPTKDVALDCLYLDDDLCYLTSAVNGDSVNVTADIVTAPRNAIPFYGLSFKESSSYYWTYNTDPENAISITGRWAFMQRESITALSRATNIVTATVASDVSVGQSVSVVGCADTSFNGTFTVVSNTGAAITWAQTASNDTDTTAILLYTPTDIVHACRRLAAWFYRQKDTQMGDGDRPILTGDGAVIMPSTLPQDVTSILMPYVRRVRN